MERLERAGEVLSPGVRAAILALEEENCLLRAELARALARIRELERRLGRNSTNSSLPPSKDPPGTVRAAPPKSPRKRGAQPGHEPHRRSLEPVERIDEFQDHYPEQCRHCGHRFALWQEVGLPVRRQVIELPEIRARLTEHRLHRLLCPCCRQVSAAEAPAGVEAPVVFGPHLVALAAVVTVRLRASRRNLRALLGDLLDVEPPLCRAGAGAAGGGEPGHAAGVPGDPSGAARECCRRGGRDRLAVPPAALLALGRDHTRGELLPTGAAAESSGALTPAGHGLRRHRHQ